MPHQCVKCDTHYEDDAEEVMKGCCCGSKAFAYSKPQEDKPVLLDLESIKQEEEGRFELDVHALFGKRSVVYKEEEGKYTIDLQESFRRHLSK